MSKKVNLHKQKKDQRKEQRGKKESGPRLSIKGRRSKSQEELEGVVSLARDGFGFVVVEGDDNDIFVTQNKLRGALNGDRVKVLVTRKGGEKHRREGEVVKIIERSKRPHIGILTVRGNQAWAIIESARMPYDIRIPIESPKDLPEIGGIKAAIPVRHMSVGAPPYARPLLYGTELTGLDAGDDERDDEDESGDGDFEGGHFHDVRLLFERISRRVSGGRCTSRA